MKKQYGFSLLEVMIALAILSISLVSFYVSHGQSVVKSGLAEDIQLATMLAHNKIAEYTLELEHQMATGSFPDESEETGEFEEPYGRYKWKIEIRKIEIPVSGGKDSGAAVGIAQQVTKKLNESLREMKLTVFWGSDENGEAEDEVVITTHLAKI